VFASWLTVLSFSLSLRVSGSGGPCCSDWSRCCFSGAGGTAVWRRVTAGGGWARAWSGIGGALDRAHLSQAQSC